MTDFATQLEALDELAREGDIQLARADAFIRLSTCMLTAAEASGDVNEIRTARRSLTETKALRARIQSARDLSFIEAMAARNDPRSFFSGVN